MVKMEINKQIFSFYVGKQVVKHFEVLTCCHWNVDKHWMSVVQEGSTSVFIEIVYHELLCAVSLKEAQQLRGQHIALN